MSRQTITLPWPGPVKWIRARATGRNNGSSWDDAFKKMPATPTKGVIYVNVIEGPRMIVIEAYPKT